MLGWPLTLGTWQDVARLLSCPFLPVDTRQAGGYGRKDAHTPWLIAHVRKEPMENRRMGQVGIEPTSHGLKVRYTAIVLLAHDSRPLTL